MKLIEQLVKFLEGLSKIRKSVKLIKEGPKRKVR